MIIRYEISFRMKSRMGSMYCWRIWFLIPRSLLITEESLRWLVGWLVGFYGISTFVGYLMPNLFLCKLFYFKQFSLAWVHSLSKTFLFQAIQFIQTVLIPLIQFSISTEVLYQTIQFSVSTISMLKTVPLQTIQFSICMQFKFKYTV